MGVGVGSEGLTPGGVRKKVEFVGGVMRNRDVSLDEGILTMLASLYLFSRENSCLLDQQWSVYEHNYTL